MMRHAAGAALSGAALLAPAYAQAHAFSAGTDFYDQFVEGAAVAMSAPEIALILVPLGIFAGLNRRNGWPLIWPAFIAAWVLGMVLGSVIGPWAVAAALGVGAIVGALAALAPKIDKRAFLAAGTVAGLFAGIASFQGHGLLQLPLFIHLGLFFGANLLTAFTAGLVDAVMGRWRQHWVEIGGRVLASWTAAMALMVLAFEVSS